MSHFGFGFIGARKKEMLYLGSASNSANQGSYTFSGWVAPRAGLLMFGVLGRGNAGNTKLSSATIGGVAATINAQNTETNDNSASIISKLVSAGTYSAVVNFNTTSSRSTIFGYFLDATSETAYGSGASSSNSASSRTVSFDVPAGGVSVYASLHGNLGSTVTWTGPSVRETLDNELRMSCADYQSTAAASAFSATCGWSGSANVCALAGASFHL
jgi:hypothetical protein